MIKNKVGSKLVYSTETGRICPECSMALDQCACKAREKAAVLGDGKVKVSRETKGRGGKCVTLVKGLALDPVALAQLGKTLRSACGSGGTVKDGVIEVQGDHCDLIVGALQKLGHSPKRAGS